MRVTNKSLMNNYMVNLNRNLQYMKKYQNQLATGKEVSRPSDDPFTVIRAMNFDRAIEQNEQHSKNIDYARGWVNVTDAALQETVDVVQNIRERTIYASNGTHSDTERKAIADEVNQNIQQLVQIANTNYDGRYILGGHNTTETPFEVVGPGEIAINHGDGGTITREISPKVTMDINVDANSYLNGPTENLGITLKNVYDRLLAGDTNALSTDSLAKLDEQIDKFLGLYAEMGAKENRLDAAYKKNEAETLNMTELLSKTEDIDIAEKVMQYTMMETVYQSTLSTGGKILQPTLLNYLR